MLTRIISAIVAIAVFIGVVYFLPPVCFTLTVAAVMAIAAYEITLGSGIVRNKPLGIISCAFAAIVPLFIGFPMLEKYLFAVAFAGLVLFFCAWLAQYGKVSLVMVLSSFFGGVVLPLLFSMILKIRAVPHGEFWILFPFVAAWMTDTGAYFSGFFFGKHKLCENISPKKTVEGAIGGTVVCIFSLIAFGMIMEKSFGADINITLLAIGALVLSVLAQVGDLSFSIIKREYNIKDYGKLMPGHGGVLDRFDSTMFTIPFSYILLIIGGIL
ncbi:MAG: phosphatidate cytidylyltransferase [Oscillospiraceae bacterium]|nr:phosphatidate cytidylyltransferase [Oscillospiraceae bacterium]